MWPPKTVKVVCEDVESGFMIINESDLTSEHVIYEEPEAILMVKKETEGLGEKPGIVAEPDGIHVDAESTKGTKLIDSDTSIARGADELSVSTEEVNKQVPKKRGRQKKVK